MNTQSPPPRSSHAFATLFDVRHHPPTRPS